VLSAAVVLVDVDAVLTADRVDCARSVSPLQLADVGSSGVVHLSPSLVAAGPTSDGQCGSDSAPWLISAHPGQRVRVTLLDFDAAVRRSSLNDTADQDQVGGCSSSTWGPTVYAVVGDAAGSVDNVTVCGGWTSQAGARVRVVYETVGHLVEIRIPVTDPQQDVPRQRRTSFVLRVSGK